ncbi:MAG TPA: cytochrome b/b6 domain-containing protein [Thermoanaerobaculia bacterium]|nr:cytochrome b/b6 domain-containing protein [Thermoanaerobaculia bacterium]
MLRLAVAVTALLAFAAAADAQLSTEDCTGCHSEQVDAAKFNASIHGSFGCSDCHSDINAYPHEPAPARVDCSSCHPDAVEAFQKSWHAKALAGGNQKSATCLSCHGGDAHAIIPSSDPASPTSHGNVPQTCGACHGQKFVMEASGFSTQPAFAYQQSVHGRAIAAGNQKAAVCTDCHNSHEVLPANSPDSPIFKFNIPATCGTCHDDVTQVFMASVHGKAVTRGNSRSPVCTDCHGIHNIKPHIDPSSSVAAQNVARTTCGQCHGNVRMTSEFPFTIGRVRSYLDSYHGLARRLGSTEAANCASCHGVHNILPQSDPQSMIHPANLTQTCGTCHPRATARFTEGRIHLGELPLGEERQLGDKIMQWVRWIYIPLILLTLGGMALHNIIIWAHKVRLSRRDPSRTIVRMNRNQRIQHFLLLTSFLVLVITGFALAWPESWFAAISGGETVRRNAHRAAAVVMMALGLYHVAYMTGTKEGRRGLRDFWFRLEDARDVVGVMKYHLGLSKVHPKMGRFTYAEKAEYWALVWGTIVMALTGLMLWFEVQVSAWLHLPRWWVDVALLIHYFEAILATLAIIIWHLYAVIFDPDVYPMNLAWFDGKMREEQYRHEHALHYEEMQNQSSEEK